MAALSDEPLVEVAAGLARGETPVALRNTIYLPLLRDGALQDAEGVLDALLAHGPKTPILWRDRASLMLKLRRGGDALDSMSNAMRHITDPQPDVVAQFLQTCLSAKEPDEAARIATAFQDMWSEDARLCHLAMLSLYRAGTAHRKSATRAALALIAHDPEALEQVTAAAPVLLSDGHATAAYHALMTAGAPASENPDALFETARSARLLGHDSDEPRSLLERVLAIRPDHYRAVDLLALVYADLRRDRDAIVLLEKIPQNKRSTSTSTHLAYALMRAGDAAAAVPLLSGVLAQAPDNIAIRRQYAAALAQLGDMHAAKQVYREGLERRRTALPDSFADGIAAIMGASVTAPVPRQRLDWIYDVLQAHGAAPSDRRAWETALHEHRAIDQLMVDWVEARPDEIDQIAPFLSLTDDTRQRLDAVVAQGSGAFVVNAHIGMLFSGPLFLGLNNYPSSWVASVPNLDDGTASQRLISTTTLGERGVGRQILRSLNAGEIITIAIDGSANTQRVQRTLFDRPIGLSEFVPRLSHRRRTPCLFPALHWTGGHVVARLTPLPDAEPGEDVDAFTDRWMVSFMAALEEQFLKWPDQLRASGGFWTRIAH